MEVFGCYFEHHGIFGVVFEGLSRHVYGEREDLRNDNRAYIHQPSLAVSAVTNSTGTFVCSPMIVRAFGIISLGCRCTPSNSWRSTRVTSCIDRRNSNVSERK
jgi:hypothetical protein